MSVQAKCYHSTEDLCIVLGNIDPDIKLQLKGSETLWKNADICDIDNKMHLNDAEQP